MVYKVDMHGMVFPKVIDHVEIIDSSNLSLVSCSHLEHIMSSDHEASIVRKTEKWTHSSNRDLTLRELRKVSEWDI